MNTLFRKPKIVLFLAVYMFSSGCWRPGGDGQAEGCQSDTSSGSSSPPPSAYNFAHPRLSYAGGSFRAVARADNRLWGFSIPANPQLSITGPYDLEVEGIAPVLASLDSTSAVAYRDSATVGFMTFDDVWTQTGVMHSFDAFASYVYLGSDSSGFILVWAMHGLEEGWQATWKRISVSGEIMGSGELALGGEPTGMIAIDGNFFVTWRGSPISESAGITEVLANGDTSTFSLERAGVLSAPALHNGAIVVAFRASADDLQLLELNLATQAITEKQLDAKFADISAMVSTERGLLVIGTGSEQDTIVGYLKADGSLLSATELPPAASVDLATGASLGFAVLEEGDRLTGYWTIEGETISMPIILAENYTGGCQMGGHTPSSSIAALLLALMFARRRRTRNRRPHRNNAALAAGAHLVASEAPQTNRRPEGGQTYKPQDAAQDALLVVA